MAAHVFKVADLFPPLGEKGGPCKVVNRIRSKGLSPNSSEKLIDTVEDDQDLENEESATVYRNLVERGPHPFTKFVVRPHAQYRMDLRSVTVKDLKESLARFVQEIEKWKRTGDRRLRDLQGKDEFEWIDPKSGLFFAFALGRQGGDPAIVTTYWSQRSTPRTPPGGCPVGKNAGYRAPAGDLAGVRTVTDEKPAKGIQDSLGDTIHHAPGESPKSDRERAKPQRTDTKENLRTNLPYPVFTKPGPSVPMADRETRTPGEPGQSDKIRVRTPGVPGEEYGHPYKENVYPRRTASEDGSEVDKEAGMFPSYSQRQRKQKGDAARYWKRYYRRNRSKIKRRSKMHYRRVRNKPLFKRKRKLRNTPKYRDRFRRLPYGGRSSLSERTRKSSPDWIDLDTGFYHPVFGWGDVVGYDTNIDKLVIHLDGEETPTAVDPIPFLSAVVFDSEESLDEVYDLLDESCADCDDEDEPDPRFVAATFYREVFTKGHNLDPGEGVQDLGAPGPESPLYLDYPDDEHHDRKPGERPDFGQVDNNPGSAKVIPEGHDFVNRMASVRPSAIRVAAKMAEILQGTAPDVLSRSRTLTFKKKKVNPANLFYVFAVPGSKGETYAVRVKLVRPKKNITDAAKMDAKVSCSCDFWRWQGPEHWAKAGDYLYGKPRGTASRPSEKDPRAQHRVCKHVAAVLDKVRQWKLGPASR